MTASTGEKSGTKIRRSQYVTLLLQDRDALELPALMRGELRVSASTELTAVALLNGRELTVGDRELRALLAARSTDWTPRESLTAEAGIDDELIDRLVEAGLLLSNDESTHLERLDERLGKSGWDPYAAVYHYTSRWRSVYDELDMEVRPGTLQAITGDGGKGFDQIVADHGPPPSHFHHRAGALDEIMLEVPAPSGELFETLRRRESTRLYDVERDLPQRQLVTILHTVWGCQGIARLSEDVTVIKKTSPSGGGLHPCEVYPLVRAVEGLESGLYHYDVGRHALRLLRAIAPLEICDTVSRLTTGQEYFASAHVVFLLTARFYRTSWKYRNHKKAYRVVLLDAGHLSQTLFLTATQLGLGAFVTAAVNEADIEEFLDIDGVSESAVAVCGCGVRLRSEPGMTLATDPWEPDRAADRDL